jgi:capsular exopolysaccharide synthesis family protein
MQQQNKASQGKNVISKLWSAYYPYWPLFLLLSICGVAGAWFYLHKKAPLYSSTASILIKDEKKGIDDSKMIESLNLISTTKIIENEIEVLKSRTLLNEVAKDLSLYAPVSFKGKWRTISAYDSTPVKIQVRDPGALMEADEVYFNYDSSHFKVAIGNIEYPVNQWVNTQYGELKFMSTGQVVKVPKQFFFSLVDLRKITYSLSKRLQATPVSKLSTVVDLKIKDEVAHRGENILNDLINAYNNAAIQNKNSLAANTLAFLDDRLAIVSKDLDSIEHRLQQYKAGREAVDISQQGQLFLKNVSDNDQKVSDVNIQLAALNQVEKYVQSKDNKGSIVPSSMGIGDPMLTQLLTKLYDAELQYEKLKKTTAENNPLIVSVADQIEKIKPNILENIQSQRRSLEASRANLYSTNSSYSSVLQTLPKKERDLVEISRQQAIQSGIYSFLLQKREEAALSNSATVADTRIVDKAESSLLPVSPNPKLIYLLSIIAAFGIGIASITGKELLARKVLYRSEIEAMTSFPVIGEISNNKTKEDLVIKEGDNTVISQQFRKLRTSLTFMGIGARHKKILVTSTMQGEGKSFVAANLALSLALANKKVVLVDLDLTNSSLSEKLGIEEKKGVASYLSGEREPEEVIKRTEASNDLFIVPTGELPHNPSELLLSERLPDLLNYLNGIFDYIVIDTAPVGALSDAYVVAPFCDTSLYVIRHGYTPKLVLERLDDSNKINELKNMAIVFNAVRTRGFSKDSYGYGYGYDYGYYHGKKSRAKKHKRLFQD